VATEPAEQFPLLIFPAPSRVGRDAGSGHRSSVHYPDHARQGQRLATRFGRLQADKVVNLLRQALNAKLATYRLAFAQQQQPQADPPLGTPAQLQDALDDCDLDHWVAKADALPSRFEAARMAAVHLLEPNVVHVISLTRRTLNSPDELKAWLAEVEQLLSARLQQGPVSL